MTTPIILVDGYQPPPLGSTAHGTFDPGGVTVNLSLNSTTGIGSLRWSVVSKPSGSTCALGNENPSLPFTTTLGPLDVEGT